MFYYFDDFIFILLYFYYHSEEYSLINSSPNNEQEVLSSFNLYHIHLILTISSFNLYHIYLISTKFPARFWFNASAATVINLWLIEYLIKRNQHWINSGKETKLNTQALTNLSLKYNSVVLNCILNPEICWNSQFLFLIYFNHYILIPLVSQSLTPLRP